MGLNEVFKKVSVIHSESVELESQEITLASLPRVNTLNDAALKFNEKITSASNNVKQAIVDLNNLLSQSINNFNKVVYEVDDIEKATKELGLPLPNEAKVARDAAKKEITQQTQLKNKVSSFKL